MFHLQKATQVTSEDELVRLAELYSYPPRSSTDPDDGAPFVRPAELFEIETPGGGGFGTMPSP